MRVRNEIVHEFLEQFLLITLNGSFLLNSQQHFLLHNSFLWFWLSLWLGFREQKSGNCLVLGVGFSSNIVVVGTVVNSCLLVRAFGVSFWLKGLERNCDVWQ